MSDLKDLLQGAGEAKRQLFTSEDFAVGYGRSVVSRVKRRRAVSATAMGGGTVVAVGAIAFGASNVPWGSFVMGASPVGSPSVVCTTTFATPTPSADNELSVLNVPSPSGSFVWGIAIGSQDPPKIVANIALDLNTHEVTGSLPNGSSLVLTPDADGVYTTQFSDGNRLSFVVAEDNLVLKSSSLEPTGEPSVACVTGTPEPTQSGSPAPSVSTSPDVSTSPTLSPSASPNPAYSWDPEAPAGSPFQCGFNFPSDESGTDALRVFGAPTTASAIHKVFEQWYGDQAPTTEVGDTQAPAFHAGLGSSDVIGATSSRDPASHESVQASRAYDIPSLGLTFVAVRDGVIVGTVVPGSDGETPGVVVDRDGEANPEEAFMWDLDALTPCGASSIEGAQIYAVAGFGRDGDFAYSWIYVSE